MAGRACMSRTTSTEAGAANPFQNSRWTLDAGRTEDFQLMPAQLFCCRFWAPVPPNFEAPARIRLCRHRGLKGRSDNPCWLPMASLQCAKSAEIRVVGCRLDFLDRMA